MQGRVSGFVCLFGLSRIDPRTCTVSYRPTFNSENTLYGFDEVLLETLRDSLPRIISLEATEQSLSHRPLVELGKTEFRRSTTGLAFRAILDATCSPHSANCFRVSTLQIVAS